MKKITRLLGVFALVLCVILLTCENSDKDDPYIDLFPISAMDLVADMGIGWNLGNTFDAVSGGLSTPIDTLESAWCGIVTKEANIQAIYDAGFRTVRIPVSWKKAADPNNNYAIRDDWMMRITQVVDWAINRGMYVIINTHHDSGYDHGPIFSCQPSAVDQSLVRFKQIWKQIAENFKWYDEKLIFEPLNEPRSTSSWTGTAEQWANLNKHYQVFVDTVRATGENNRSRFLLFNTYAASRSSGPMNALELPKDPAKGKHIAGYHAYVPDTFAFGGIPGTPRGDTVIWNEAISGSSVTAPMHDFYNKFVSQGIPVIIGETGATNKNNESERAAWAEFYVKSAKEMGMCVIVWDNNNFTIPASGDNNELFGLLNRSTSKIAYPLYMEGLLKGLE